MTPKHLSHRSLTVAAFLVFTGYAHAQNDAGFLGKRYVAGALFVESVHDVDIDAGTGFHGNINLPISSNLDFNGNGSYERFGDYSIRDKRLGATLVAYHEFNTIKPFVEAGIFGTWQSSTIAGRTYKNHDGLYVAGLGVEAAVSSRTAFFAKAVFNKYFDSTNGHYWTYTAGASTWFSEKVGAYASASFNESESTVYTLGVAFRL